MKNNSFNSVIILCIISLTACHDQPTENNAVPTLENFIHLTHDQKNNLGIGTSLIQLDTIYGEIKIQGMVMVQNQQMQFVSFPVSAKIESLMIEPGQEVSKNQTMAILTDLSFIQWQEDFLSTQLEAEQAEREFNRQQELWSKNATSDKAYQDSKSQWNLLQTKKEGLTQRLQLIGIPIPSSPASIVKQIPLKAEQAGKISACLVQPGQFITAGQQIARITDTQKLWVDASLYQLSDLSKISNNRVVLTDNKNKTATGHIEHHSNEISANDQAAHVWISIDQNNNGWIPGMPISCQLQMQDMPAIVIPKNALVNFENHPFVFVTQNEDDFEMISVQVIQESETQIFLSPIAELTNKKIVTEGAYYLLMASKNKGE